MRRLWRTALLVGSIGLALHLLLPQLPGIERSLRLVAGTSHALVGAAFLAELASELCYAELLGRSVGVFAAARPSSGSGRPGRWFMFRLTITGYGAAHVLPGGGATAATVTYDALRRKGFERGRIALAVAAVSVLVYVALGTIFSASVVYLLLRGDLDPAERVASVFSLTLTLCLALGAYLAHVRPTLAKNTAKAAAGLIGRLPVDGSTRRRAETWSVRLVSRLGEELREAHRQLISKSAEGPKLAALALGYWALDALCLILMFAALNVAADPLVLLVAYGVATALAAMPLTPGGIGIFEATVLAALAVLGVGPEAAIPVLGYRLFNFWLPIPLAAVFYPTLRAASR